jgi:hypothetical protein
MQRAQADAFIRRVTWLAETPVAFQDRLLAKCDILRLRKAETLYDVGDAATGLYASLKDISNCAFRREAWGQRSRTSADPGAGLAISPR